MCQWVYQIEFSNVLFRLIIARHNDSVAPQIIFGSFKSIGDPSGLQQ